MRHSGRFTPRLYGLSLLAGAALAGFALAPVPAAAAKSDNSIRFAYDQAPENLDPYFNNVRIGVILGPHVWDTLVYRNPDTSEYEGLLATAWRQVDERTLEFDLRQGVKFHNGQEFTADDVVYTLNFVAKPESKVVTQQNVDWIDRAEKIEPYKVRVITKQPFPAAIEYLAGPVVIHPHEYYSKVGPRGMNEKPVGTGPFRVARNVPGKSITLERNPDYFKGGPKTQPKIAKLEIRVIPDRQTQVAELLSGGIDLIMNVPKDQAEQIETVPNQQVLSGETMRIAFLRINSLPDTPAPALKDVRVRRALNHAIDRDTLAREIVGKGARVINTICYPSQFGCTDEGAPRYAYDPAKAKQLLAEAGFPNGFDVDLYAYRERDQTEAMIGYLRAVGIRANLRFMQYAAMRDEARAHRAAMAHQTWGSSSVNDVSAATPVYFELSPDDVTHDQEVADLLRKGDTSIDPHLRKDAYKRALELIAERAYAVPLYALPTYYAAARGLDFKAYADEMPRFWEMSWK